MMSKWMLGLVVLFAFYFPAMGQQESIADHPQSSADKVTAFNAMTQVPAYLETKLDARKAKVGDAVEAKTTKTVKTVQGVEIAKGSKLLGTITNVQAQTKVQEQSLLTIRFSQVQLHNGQQMMIRTIIDNVYKPALPTPLDAPADNRAKPNQIAGPVRGAGMSGSRVGDSGMVGGLAHPLEDHMQSGASKAKQEVLESSEGVAGDAERKKLLLADHVASFPGIMLSGAATSMDSTTLSSAGRNLHLDCGTQLLLSIAVQQ